ncbi:MAG TPA: hypothetical protein VI363_07835, partial [Burkholderiales bacterium]
LVAARTFTSAAGAFSRIEVRESYGQLKYESPTGTQDRVPDWILEARVLAGRDFVGNGVSFSPYLGLGYRYLYNDFRGYLSATNAVAYRRYSNTLYAPVGLAARVQLGDRWVLVPTVEVDVFLQGRQVTKLSDLDAGFSDVTNQQSRGRGHRASLVLERDHWSVGAWTQYWNIKDSDAQCTALTNGTCGFSYVEPQNYTRETGLELRYRF